LIALVPLICDRITAPEEDTVMEESDPDAPISHASKYRNQKSNNNVPLNSNIINGEMDANLF
jgi:hypothetical protein